MFSSRPFATRSWSAASRRFTRDVIVAAAAAGIGALAFSALMFTGEAPRQRAEAKLTDRLSFIQEEVPVRETRIYDTLAIFAEPQGEAGPWSDRPVPLVKVAEVSPTSTTVEGGKLPRMASGEARGSRHAGALPSARPIQIASTASAASAQADAPAREPSTQPRGPLRVFGWSVPGTQVLPTRKDAFTAVARIGDAAVEIGSGTVDVVGGTASSVGRTVTSLGGNLAESIGWR